MSSIWRGIVCFPLLPLFLSVHNNILWLVDLTTWLLNSSIFLCGRVILHTLRIKPFTSISPVIPLSLVLCGYFISYNPKLVFQYLIPTCPSIFPFVFKTHTITHSLCYLIHIGLWLDLKIAWFYCVIWIFFNINKLLHTNLSNIICDSFDVW